MPHTHKQTHTAENNTIDTHYWKQ